MKHFYLKMTFLLGIALCTLPLYAKKAKYTTLKPLEYQVHIEQTDSPCIIDIRSASDYATGHIEGAINIASNDLYFLSKLKQLSPNSKTIFIYCKLGKTSKAVAELLVINGYNHVINLKGGITAWGKKLPIVMFHPE